MCHQQPPRPRIPPTGAPRGRSPCLMALPGDSWLVPVPNPFPEAASPAGNPNPIPHARQEGRTGIPWWGTPSFQPRGAAGAEGGQQGLRFHLLCPWKVHAKRTSELFGLVCLSPPLQEGVGEILLAKRAPWLVLLGCLWLGPDQVSKLFPSR